MLSNIIFLISHFIKLKIHLTLATHLQQLTISQLKLHYIIIINIPGCESFSPTKLPSSSDCCAINRVLLFPLFFIVNSFLSAHFFRGAPGIAAHFL